VTAGLLGDN